MGKYFDEKLSKVSQLAKYNKVKSSRILDDMATAYISGVELKGLDEALSGVFSIRKSLLSQGYTIAEIDDYLLEYSYITKTQIRKLRTQSIYMNDSVSIAPNIENIETKVQKRKETDLIIDILKSKPDLLKALQKGIARTTIESKFKTCNTSKLIDFYNQHKSIID